MKIFQYVQTGEVYGKLKTQPERDWCTTVLEETPVNKS
jgi:hypothetical protein